jgi:hypothetical protein
MVQACAISNKYYGMYGEKCSQLYSTGNTGSTNTIGIMAFSNATVGQNGTQIGGTTATSTGAGGAIR